MIAQGHKILRAAPEFHGFGYYFMANCLKETAVIENVNKLLFQLIHDAFPDSFE